MALGDLHIFTGEEYVDTELAPLLNENFNSLKEYVDDASRWQVMPVQFKGTNAKFLIHETTLGTGTTQVLPLVVLDNTDIAKFSTCSLKVVMSTKNGSTAAVNCDISLQKVHNSNECNVNFNTTNSDDAKAEPCTFTYNNIKYAGLKLTTGNADTLWVSGYTTEEWIAPVVDTSVTNLVTLGSDMNVIPTLFKSLQTDKSPVNDYDVVNKKSLNDLTNIKTYSQLSQIGLSGNVLDHSPYEIGNALPANSMLIIGVSGSTNNHDYPVMTGNLTVVRAHSNHVMFQIDAELNNNDVQRYILQYKIDSVDSSAAKNWKRILTDVDTGYWQPNETVTRDTVRKLVGKQYAGCFLVCKVAGTTGSTQPSPDPADGAGIGGGSGSITIYTSLEQIGITPGQETLESIHNAMPINSELVYYRTISTTYNHAIYPAESNYGYFKATKLWNNVTKFEYLQYTTTANTEDDSTTTPYINVGVLWSTYLDATTTYKPVWNKSYTQQLQTFVQKVNNKLPDEDGNVSLFDISNVTSIPADSNLNDYIETGRYACILNTTAQSLSNNPMAKLATGIILEVIVYGSFVFQILYGTLIRGLYVRRRTNSDSGGYVWNEWKNINNGIAYYSLSGTGWSQFENGLIFAWKVVTADNSGNKVITKPTSFKTYSITFGDRGDGSSSPSILPMVRYDLTTNTTDTIIGATSSSSNAYYMFWVGYKEVVD